MICSTHSTLHVWLPVQSFIGGQRQGSFFYANKFLNVRGNIQQGDDKFSDVSRGGHEVVIILSDLTVDV